MHHRINLKTLQKEPKKRQINSFNLKNFLEIANSKLNPDVSTVEGLEQFLKTWYCFQYGTTEKDDKLLQMTLEELVVLYQMHRIKEDPSYYDKLTGNQDDEYEKWLQEQMGEAYVTEEENVEQILEADKKYKKMIEEEYPDQVLTDFSQFKDKNE